MDRIKMCLDELHNDVQTFNRNNQILVDNWQDRKSEHFCNTCITIVNGTCQEYMQTVEQTRIGINSSIEQLKAMEQELSKAISSPTWAD
jgi:hypothetical protein